MKTRMQIEEGGIEHPLRIRVPVTRTRDCHKSLHALRFSLRSPSNVNKLAHLATRTASNEIRDVLPTFLDAAGATIPESIEGKSLLQLVKSKGEGWRPYIDLEHNVCYARSNHWNGFTDGNWKYLYHAMEGEEQLFHLETDPNELEDLAGLSKCSDELKLWRGRIVTHLEPRGDLWVRNGKLIPRPRGMNLSPNFPGYQEPKRPSR